MCRSRNRIREISLLRHRQKYGVKIDFRRLLRWKVYLLKNSDSRKCLSWITQQLSSHRVMLLTISSTVYRIACNHTETMKYFCVTEAVALYIQKYVQYRKRKIFFGNTGKFEDLLPSIVKHKTEKYLVPMSDVHTDEIKNLLDKNKIQNTEAVMYRTVSNDFTSEEEFDYDMLVFFSPAGVTSLKKNFRTSNRRNQNRYVWLHYRPGCT